ncbi:hypothetical protein GFC01_07755 [Desulfofundulus thermobenzoicus]|uniref:CobQ/CobB/MinD/ParA nucleotide binding domain-containing protein n=1 Tax=Desulfofundulus thermobenzoicus TaxID=29376 RepID=A0A6N7IQ31_9FIRM|nr:hypothetical protein [Desulfofundulus thermobenzoicus]MQL52166.1 hypothetical protein [Desulfofundulus thermobenzoicus]
MAQKMIAVYGVREGSGKTVVARELAGAYQLRGKKTLLVDMVLGGGQIAGSLGLSPEPNLGQWLQEMDRQMNEDLPPFALRFSPEEVAPFIQHHYTGLDVLAASPLDFPGRAAGMVEVVITHLRPLSHEVIIFDTRSVVREYVLRLLSLVDTVLLVTDSYRYHLEYAAGVLERLREAGVTTDHFQLVLNRMPTLTDESPREAARQLGLPLAGVLPELPAMQPGRNNRTLSYELVDHFTRSINQLVERLE